MAPKWNPTHEQLLETKRRLAEEPGLSQRKLAAELGVDQASISRQLSKLNLIENAGAQPSPVILIPHARLRPDPNQPRRTFADEGLDELAATIESQGLLQNLLVKPAGEDGVHEITSGERRWRAIGRLIEQGRWQGDIPCNVRDGDAAQQLARAIIENLQREDVAPLEEADAFARLQEMDPEAYPASTIAVMIGKTPRFVQQRIALARKLHPAVKRLLQFNLLTVESCRHLAALEQADQAEIVMEEFYFDSTEDFLGENGPTDDELTGWEAASTENIEGQITYLLNRKEREAREAEQRARVAEDDAATAEDEEDDQAELLGGSSLGTAPDRAPRTTQQNVSDEPDALPLPEPAGPPVTKNHIYHAHRRKSMALRNAVALDSTAAMRLTCLALLTRAQGSVMIRPSGLNDGSWTHDDLPAEMLWLSMSIEKYAGKVDPHYLDDKKRVKLWQKLEDLNEDDLHRLFAALVARQIVAPAGLDCILGDHPLTIAIAKSLGVAGREDNNALTLAREDLNGMRKPVLLALADEIGAPGVNDSTKTADLIEAIAATKTDYVFPTLRFATTEQTEKALKEIGK